MTSSPLFYVCKYTPVELLAGFGATCKLFDDPSDEGNVDNADIPMNLCGFGKAVLRAALSGEIDQLILVNCCDVMRRTYDILSAANCCDFLYLLDLPHCSTACAQAAFAANLRALRDDYAAYSGRSFDVQAFRAAFVPHNSAREPYAGILGVRCGHELEKAIETALPLPVRNLTCTGGHNPLLVEPEGGFDKEEDLLDAYAAALLAQIPCHRMADTAGRRQLFNDPLLSAIVYHTMKFCDFYGSEYADIKHETNLPLLKLESDFTHQSAGQLSCRLEAFAETLSTPKKRKQPMEQRENAYVAGIDSGSASTDVVIMDANRTIIASAVIPTGGGAQTSAQKSLDEALALAGIPACAIAHTVATGYGRNFIDGGDESITEITCHAKGAHYLNPLIRTVIDIGGQDSKAICLDANGSVKNFTMNDKCAAGTGRFLEMMARTLGMSLQEMGNRGLDWHHEIGISNMCTVFAESEVVTLVAQSKPLPDIIHGLNRAVAAKTAGLVKRIGGEPPYMMTGGVAHNPGVVAALEDKLGAELIISEQAQICGAIGAALFALED